MPSTSLSRRHEQAASSADQGVQRPRGCDGAGGAENNIFSPILPSAAKMMSLDEESKKLREAALVSQEATRGSRQRADGSGHTGTAAPGAEAGDQYSLMLRMTQRMERLGNEVNSFRDEMMTFFIISMNTGEAEARADTAAAAAKEETERSMARVEHEIEQETAQKLGLQDKKIEDLQKLQAVEYNVQAANTNAAQGAARADANPLPQLDGATMILVTGVGTEGLYERHRPGEGQAAVRKREVDQDANRGRSQTLRQRLEREAGYGPAARLRLPLGNPRSGFKDARTCLPESRMALRASFLKSDVTEIPG